MSSAVRTASAVSPGSIWNTPKPSCGMVAPSFSSMVGTWLTVDPPLSSACPVHQDVKRPGGSDLCPLIGGHEVPPGGHPIARHTALPRCGTLESSPEHTGRQTKKQLKQENST